VGNELARDMLLNHGLAPEKLHVTGIPVDPDILIARDREAVRRQHGIGDQPVITLIGSGISETHVRIMVEGLLARNVEGTLYVVAGRNHDLLEEIDDIEGTERLSFKPLGFIDYLDDLMVMSDLIITKSGGLITSELLARATPMIIIDPIPGQEEYNADYVTQMGAGVHARLPESVPYLVEHLLQHPEQLARFRTQAREFGRPRAALDIAAKVLADASNRRPDFGVAAPGLNL
jgi:processive 1,2-diacylglycerol beta-glucosyltransferase